MTKITSAVALADASRAASSLIGAARVLDEANASLQVAFARSARAYAVAKASGVGSPALVKINVDILSKTPDAAPRFLYKSETSVDLHARTGKILLRGTTEETATDVKPTAVQSLVKRACKALNVGPVDKIINGGKSARAIVVALDAALVAHEEAKAEEKMNADARTLEAAAAPRILADVLAEAAALIGEANGKISDDDAAFLAALVGMVPAPNA